MILERLFSPARTHDNIARRQSQALAILRRINVRMLVIDEIHHVLAGPVIKQRQFLNVVKFLGTNSRSRSSALEPRTPSGRSRRTPARRTASSRFCSRGGARG